jgi:hypothetical protein
LGGDDEKIQSEQKYNDGDARMGDADNAAGDVRSNAHLNAEE